MSTRYVNRLVTCLTTHHKKAAKSSIACSQLLTNSGIGLQTSNYKDATGVCSSSSSKCFLFLCRLSRNGFFRHFHPFFTCKCINNRLWNGALDLCSRKAIVIFVNRFEGFRRGESTRQVSLCHRQVYFNQLGLFYFRKLQESQLQKVTAKVVDNLPENWTKTPCRVEICLIRKGNGTYPVASVAQFPSIVIWIMAMTKQGPVTKRWSGVPPSGNRIDNSESIM